ncbi:MAG: methionine adenosyltransferase [Thermodesulfobacteriota bacterium]
MRKDYVFISESVTEGHPDKLCDQISDAVMDHFLSQDPYARVRAECAISTSILFIAARFASEIKADIPNLARKVIGQAGYSQPDFDARTCSVLTSFQEYPPDADLYFNENRMSEEQIDRVHVRQQATVFGYACRQTEVLMPLPIWLAHKLARQMIAARLQRLIPYLSPDGKTQVGVEYRDRKPYRIHSISIIASRSKSAPENIDMRRFHDDVLEAVVRPSFAGEAIRPDDKTMIFINPVENLMVGGPGVHSGLTGRKTDVDTYGDYARHGGNALSGKDPMRIDRVGAYAARHAAKNLVAAGLAEECEVQLSYSIGLPRPVSIMVETFGTGKLSDDDLANLVEEHFDFRLAGILKRFQLRHLPSLHKGKFYQRLAAYGQVGRADISLPWEETDKVDLLRNQ